MTLCVTVQVQSFKGYYPCISSQLAEKFSLLRYNQDIIDLFNLFGIHMYIVYTSRLYVWLFKFNHSTRITPAYHHNLARSLHCYVTTMPSLTFSIYLGAMYIVCTGWLCVWLTVCSSEIIEWILPLYIITTWREVYIVMVQRQRHRPFQFIWDPYVYRL